MGQSTVLERQVEELTRAVVELTTRVAALEQAKVAPVAAASAVQVPSPPRRQGDNSHALGTLPLVGRTCLALGGAYVLRALTEAGWLSSATGVAAGLLYAAAFLLLADRTGRGATRESATFHGLAGVAVALPLLWEATVRLAVLPAGAAAGLLALFTVSVLFISWHRSLYLLAWIATLGALTAALTLLAAVQAAAALAAALLGLAAAVFWLTRGGQWPELRWPVALAADLVVAVMAETVARPGSLAAAGASPPSASVALALSLALPLLYLGHLGLTILALGRSVGVFEMAQTPLALAVGLVGAVRVAAVAGLELSALGFASLALACCCYVVGLRQREPHLQINSGLCTSLALGLLLAAAPLAVRGLPLTLTWSAVSVLTALAAVAWAHPLLGLHAATYGLAAAIAAGLPGAVAHSFAGPVVGGITADAAFLASLVSAALAHAVLAAAAGRSRHSATGISRTAEGVTGVVTVSGLGALAVQAALGLVSSASTPTPSTAAAVRTAVIAAASLALALAGRHRLSSRLAWLAHPVLVLGGLKLVFEDLRGGTASLVVSFACYGIALILVPRLRRWSRTAPDGLRPDPP